MVNVLEGVGLLVPPPNGRRAQGNAIILPAPPAVTAATLLACTRDLNTLLGPPLKAYCHARTCRDDMILAKAVIEQFAVRETIGGPLILTAGYVASSVHARILGESAGQPSADEMLERVLAILGTLRGANMVKQLASPSGEHFKAGASIAAASESTSFFWCGPSLIVRPLAEPAKPAEPTELAGPAKPAWPAESAPTPLPSQKGKRRRAQEPAASSAYSPGAPLTGMFKQTKKAATKPRATPPAGAGSEGKNVAVQQAKLTPVNGGASKLQPDDTVSIEPIRHQAVASSPLPPAPSRKANRLAPESPSPRSTAAARATGSAAAKAGSSAFAEGNALGGALPPPAGGAARRGLDQAFEAEQGRQDELTSMDVALSYQQRLPLPGAPRAPAGYPLQPVPFAPSVPGQHPFGGEPRAAAHASGLRTNDATDADELECIRALMSMPELSGLSAGGVVGDDFGAFADVLDACAVTGEQLALELMRAEEVGVEGAAGSPRTTAACAQQVGGGGGAPGDTHEENEGQEAEEKGGARQQHTQLLLQPPPLQPQQVDDAAGDVRAMGEGSAAFPQCSGGSSSIAPTREPLSVPHGPSGEAAVAGTGGATSSGRMQDRSPLATLLQPTTRLEGESCSSPLQPLSLDDAAGSKRASRVNVRGGLRRFAGRGVLRGVGSKSEATTGNQSATVGGSVVMMSLPFRFAPAAPASLQPAPSLHLA